MGPRGYQSWCAVASYFDGDGTVELEISKLTLRFRLTWADNWRPQIEQLQRFLQLQGVRTERVVYARGAFHLPVGEIRSMRAAARNMLESGCAYKKCRELTALLSYYDNKLTGNQVVAEFNRSIHSGNRSGYEKTVNLPLTYIEARKLQARLAGKGAREVRQKVDGKLKDTIADERARLGLSVRALAELHRLSDRTISRMLRESLALPSIQKRGTQTTLD